MFFLEIVYSGYNEIHILKKPSKALVKYFKWLLEVIQERQRAGKGKFSFQTRQQRAH